MLTVLPLLLVLAPQAGPAETLVALRPGDRVVVENLSGELSVSGWNRDELAITGEDDDRVRAERDGRTVRIVGAPPRREVEASIRVPTWVELEIGGPDLELGVQGIGGALNVRNVRGDVRVADVEGPLDIRSIEGEIVVMNAGAGVLATSQSGDVLLSGVSGPVQAHSGDGDVTLDAVAAPSLRAETQDGDVSFNGPLLDGGTYEFSVHDGDVVRALAESANGVVRISTFDADFESEFPVVVERFTGGRPFDFQIGTGGARVQIEVFDGDIRILRR